MRVAAFGMTVLLVCSVSARAQSWDQMNTQCEASCRSGLDQCAAVFNKIMETALKETTAYTVGSSRRERADVKFEGAFLKTQNCWDTYYMCTRKCRAPKRCINACQSTFARCFAAGERKMREGLREMRHANFGSPEWQAAYAKGNAETDRCLQDDQSCQAKCANP